ncbi:MAG: M14 family zinc carboxypeptidase, partial [Tumebacillaceae bacterium]
MRHGKKKKTNRTAGLALTALLLSGAFAALPSTVAHADPITVYRITTDSTHTVDQLRTEDIDIWDVQPNFVEAPLTSTQIAWLQTNGWSYGMNRQANGPSFGSSFHTYASVQSILADRASRFKNLATVVTIGHSYEGQPIQVMKITSNSNKNAKPKSLWIGGTHAREIAPPEVMLSNIDYLLNGYGTDPDVTWMLDNREIYILPVMNPDGHHKAEQLLNWRKNTDTRWGGDGVDLNRNYDEMPLGVWGNPIYGTSTNPFNEEFCGGYAFSEPETQAVRNLVEGVMGTTGTPSTVQNGFNMVVDMHTYGNLIMWPWNWTSDVSQYGATSDIANMQKIGEKFATYNT